MDDGGAAETFVTRIEDDGLARGDTERAPCAEGDADAILAQTGDLGGQWRSAVTDLRGQGGSG